MTGDKTPGAAPEAAQVDKEVTDVLVKLRLLTNQLPKPGRSRCESGTVLIVEDDPNCRRVLKDILTKADYKVYQAKDYQEAKGFASLRPAVALIDLRLPGGANGLKVGQMLRDLSPGTKNVLLTAYSTESTAIRAVNLNFAGYFQKPYDAGELLALLQNWENKANDRAARIR